MRRALGWGAAVAILASGCGTRGELYTKALAPLPWVATQSKMVLVVPQTERLVSVAPGDQTPVSVPISPKAKLAVAVPGTDTVLVLAGTPKDAVLDLVDVASGEVRTAALPGLFDLVSFSPDGRWAVLTYSASGGGGGGLVAKNLNEVALVELPTATVTRVQLDTESLAPRAVLFGPDEPDRQLVAVALERGVAIFDARDPATPPRRISIRPQGSQVESSVVGALFARDAQFLYLRATGLDDVIAVELSRGPEGLGASINFLAGGKGLSDIALPPGDEDGVLAVYPDSLEAFRLDPHGIQDNVSRLDLPAPLTTIRPLSGTRVLFYSRSSKSVVAWDVRDGRTGTAVLDNLFTEPVFAEDLSLGVFPSPVALSVVTVEDDVNRLRARIRSILLQSPMERATVDAQERRLFFTATQSKAVVTLNLTTLELAQLDTDVQPGGLYYVADSDQVAVVNIADKLGDITFAPAGSGDRAEAVRFRYVALTDELDRPREDAP